MGLPSTFPWLCAALSSFPAVILAAIAAGLPLWSQFTNGALPANGDYEYGMWEACTITNGFRRCGTAWHAPGQNCHGLLVSFQVTGMIGLSFLFLGMLLSCALFKKPIKALCAAVFCCFFIATMFMITAMVLWIVIAENPLCYFEGEPLRNYGPSFIMWVVALALASMAMCLTCFGLLGALKKFIPAIDAGKTQEIEYVEEPVFEYAAPQYAAPQAYVLA